jgi:hypothetical protein
MIRMPSQNDGMSVLIISCGLILLSGEHSLAAESSPPSADTTAQPRALEEFKPLTPGGTLPGGTLRSGTLPGGTLPGGTLRAAHCLGEPSQAARFPGERYQEGRYPEARWKADHCSHVPLAPTRLSWPEGSRR